MKQKILPYNDWHGVLEEKYVMPKRRVQLKEVSESFGIRLARLRKAAGYSQRELAAEIGISHRMVAYYEGETEHPPTTLLPLISKVLGVSTDQLLGVKPTKGNGRTRDTRLWRRFAQVEKLPPDQRKPIIQVLDAFLKTGKSGESR